MSTVNGKKPLSKKAPPTPTNLEDIFGNTLGIDPAVAKEIEAKGLVYRFISAPQLQKMGGYHPRGWKPYKQDRGTMDVHSLQFGSDPDGFIRRGELILAVRPKDLNEKHKAVLKQKAARGRETQTTHANELKEMIRGSVGMQVHEGYEDPNEKEED